MEVKILMSTVKQQPRAPGTRVSLPTSPSKEGTRRHFLDNFFYGLVFFILISVTPFPSTLSFTMGRAQIMASFRRHF